MPKASSPSASGGCGIVLESGSSRFHPVGNEQKQKILYGPNESLPPGKQAINKKIETDPELTYTPVIIDFPRTKLQPPHE